MLPYFHRTPSRSARSAFSLLELLVVMAVMGILLAMTMAVGPGILRSTAMSTSLSSVASAVSLARSEAIRSRKQTYFALAPDSGTLDERSYVSYAVIRQEDTSGPNCRYVTPWKKLPAGVLFSPTDTANQQLLATNLPYPTETNTTNSLRVISFVSDGSLEEDIYANKPYLPLRAGTRASATSQPDWQGGYITNEIFVELRSGKVKVVRAGDQQ